MNHHARPKSVPESAIEVELPDEPSAIALAQKIANRFGKAVAVLDSDGNSVCVAPIKLNG